MATLGTFSEYARHAGFSPQRVHQLHRAGRVVMRETGGPRPRVDFEATDERVKATGHLGQADNGVNAKRGNLGGRPPLEHSERIGLVFRQAQAQDKAFKAKLSEVEYHRAAGALVERSTVESAVFDAFRALRDRQIGALRACAQDLALLTDVREIESVMFDALRLGFNAFEQHVSEQLAARMAAK